MWGGMRSNEGLNELGEAPPPYEMKRIAAAEAGLAGGGGAANAQANANPAGQEAGVIAGTEPAAGTAGSVDIGTGAGAATNTTTNSAPAPATTTTIPAVAGAGGDAPASIPTDHVPRQLRDMENGAMPPEYAERLAEPTVPPPVATIQR